MFAQHGTHSTIDLLFRRLLSIAYIHSPHLSLQFAQYTTSTCTLQQDNVYTPCI